MFACELANEMRAYTEFPEFDGSPQGFKEAIAEAALAEASAGAFVHVSTTLNKLIRPLLKPRPARR